jgi:hypothetical protein
MRADLRLMSFKSLFAILVALAVLVAPSAAFAGMAVAAHHRGMQSMEMGHCQTPPSKDADRGKADKNCCISMCLTLAVAPAAPAGAVEVPHAVTYFTAPQSWHGYLGEIATPPPRTA